MRNSVNFQTLKIMLIIFACGLCFMAFLSFSTTATNNTYNSLDNQSVNNIYNSLDNQSVNNIYNSLDNQSVNNTNISISKNLYIDNNVLNRTFVKIETAATLISISVLIFIMTNILDLFYIKPYLRFKEEMIKTKITVAFYQNILTNAFDINNLDDIRLNEINKSKKELRDRWANTLVRYENVHIPCFIVRVLKINYPPKVDMDELSNYLLEISNMSLIYTPENTTARNECVYRYKIITYILETCT